jgi:anaerobic selenocysteine-containing dehydrogenase
VCATDWAELVRQSGVSERQTREVADDCMAADRTVISWCPGVTQQDPGVDTVREIVNLLMPRGSLGREGAGPSPVRGHSNVQGHRTCGIDHRPGPELLDALDEVRGMSAPRVRTDWTPSAPSRRWGTAG